MVVDIYRLLIVSKKVGTKMMFANQIMKTTYKKTYDSQAMMCIEPARNDTLIVNFAKRQILLRYILGYCKHQILR